MVVKNTKTDQIMFESDLTIIELKCELRKTLVDIDTSFLDASIMATKGNISPEESLHVLRNFGFQLQNLLDGINADLILCYENGEKSFSIEYGKSVLF